ncbi:hypothetical protein [Micromonospora sp. U56]|uniref:DUF6924 domain-containing protein n=1 Tax=Micromonospora sp. U56 TaxID=2824900 RepID=UPI0035A95DC9
MSSPATAAISPATALARPATRAMCSDAADLPAPRACLLSRPVMITSLRRLGGRRTFLVPPRWYAEVSANMSIANMGFADAADESGTFCGFEGD